jgi:hypothetical protein
MQKRKRITNRLENHHRHHRTSHANLYRICTCHLVFQHTSLWIASIQEGPHLQFKTIVGSISTRKIQGKID